MTTETELLEKIKKFARVAVTLWKKEIQNAIEYESVGYTFPVWIGNEKNTPIFTEELTEALKERLVPAIFERFEVLSEECKSEDSDGSAKDGTKYRKVLLRLKK